MTIPTHWWTIILTVLSSIILFIETDVISIENIGLSLKFLSIKSVELKKPIVIAVIAVALIVLSGFHHSIIYAKNLYALFSNSYTNTKYFVEHVSSHIAGIVGHTAVGAPINDFKPSFFRKDIKIVPYQQQNGQMFPQHDLSIPDKIHRVCLISGIAKAVLSRTNFFGLAPIVLGILAITYVFI